MNNKFLSKTTIASLAIITAVLCACTSEKPVSESEILFADPTIFVENGKYYLTGTRENGGGGFQILESDNLENWHYYNEDSTYFNQGNKHSEIKDSGLPRFTKKMEFTIFSIQQTNKLLQQKQILLQDLIAKISSDLSTVVRKI